MSSFYFLSACGSDCPLLFVGLIGNVCVWDPQSPSQPYTSHRVSRASSVFRSGREEWRLRISIKLSVQFSVQCLVVAFYLLDWIKVSPFSRLIFPNFEQQKCSQTPNWGREEALSLWGLTCDLCYLTGPSWYFHHGWTHLVSRGWQNVSTLELNRKFWWSYWLHQVNRHGNIIKNPSRTQKMVSFINILVRTSQFKPGPHAMWSSDLLFPDLQFEKYFPVTSLSPWLESPENVISVV